MPNKYLLQLVMVSFYVLDKNCQICQTKSSSISCTSCKDGYAFVNNNKQKCLDKNTLIQKYYQIDPQNYYSCYESCLACI